jgi:hypothetical protein
MNFLKNYGKLLSLRSSLLKNNVFPWREVEEYVFCFLKYSMCTIIIYVVPNFTMNIFFECGASGRHLKVVLMQEGHCLTFTIKYFCDQILGKFTYDKEIIDMLHVVETYHPYITRRNLYIKTNNHSLKYYKS